MAANNWNLKPLILVYSNYSTIYIYICVFYLLGVHFVDGRVREAVVMEEPHLLVEQAVDDVSPRILPLDEADQLTVQRGAQVHGPVVAVQRHLKR